MGETDHVKDIVSPASFGVSHALNSAGGIRNAGDCAKSSVAVKRGIKKIAGIRKVFLNTFMNILVYRIQSFVIPL